jgi:hypothetical protein
MQKIPFAWIDSATVASIQKAFFSGQGNISWGRVISITTIASLFLPLGNPAEPDSQIINDVISAV